VRIYATGFFDFRAKGSQMARPDKAAAVAELTEDFRTANATVLTEYRGLSVTSMKELRRALGSDTKYSVVLKRKSIPCYQGRNL